MNKAEEHLQLSKEDGLPPDIVEDAEEVIAVLLDEQEWRRVRNFVTFLHTGQPNLFEM